MSEHKIKNTSEGAPQNKATHVVQSYYDQNGCLISQSEIPICDGQPDSIQNLSCDEVKHILIRQGMWPQYTKRIKNLERVELEFWKLYDLEVDLEKKIRTLENIANIQSIISNCYGTAKEFLVGSKKGELQN